MSWNPSLVFIMDTRLMRLGGWYADIKGIVDIVAFGNDIYLLHSNQAERDAARDGSSSPVDMPALQYHCEHLSMLTPGEAVMAMVDKGLIVDAGEVMFIERCSRLYRCIPIAGKARRSVGW